jgi:predicted enzyme related to lactoylglutathione lyase
MGEVTAYPHGTFNWVDLGTDDVGAAKDFYGSLFGWDLEDLRAEDGITYTMCTMGGHSVCGVHGPTDHTGWGSGISVDDVDAITSRARELGASVVTEPRDVADAGRGAQLVDPGGALISLWQPRAHMGAGLVNEVSTWSWNELVTSSLDTAGRFYGDLLGWSTEMNPGDFPRAAFTLGDLLVGGAHAPTSQEGDESRWTVSFRVDEVDGAVARVGRLGGRTLLPAMDIPIGRFAIVSDPSGAAFTVTEFPAGPFRGVDGS